MAGSKAGYICTLAVLLADAIVRAANLRGFDLDSDLLASRRDVYEFSFHCYSLQWCERGDSNPHTFRYQILSLARLPIPPLSHNQTYKHSRKGKDKSRRFRKFKEPRCSTKADSCQSCFEDCQPIPQSSGDTPFPR